MLDFDQIIKSDLLLEFYKKYNLVWDNHSDYPYLNYFGLNFDKKGIVSVKFYFHLFHRLTTEEVNLFLPEKTNDFFKYYDLHDFSKVASHVHTGSAFELKFKNTYEPTYGFHYRLRACKESYALIGFPQKINLKFSPDEVRPGINYEYTCNETLVKKYYQFDAKEHIDFFANKLGHLFFKTVDIMEYSESVNHSKVNCQRDDYSVENLQRPSFLNTQNKQMVDKICDRYNVINLVDGYYLDEEVVSTYFVVNPFVNKTRNNQVYHHDAIRLLGVLNDSESK